MVGMIVPGPGRSRDMPEHRILSVGQCAYDHGSLTRHLGQRLNAKVTPAGTPDEALAQLRAGRFELVLVNRVIDADDSSGLELIRTLRSDPTLSDVPVMLVSDIARAQ